MNKPTIFLIFKPILGLFLISIFAQTLSAQLPTGFVDTKMQGNYTAPMGVVFSKDGKTMFVWEKKGTLWTSKWDGTAYIKQSSVTLDIREEVGDWSELGFQSVALDPNFDTNGLVYMYYQVDRHHLMKFGTPQYSAASNEYGSASISRVTRYKLNNSNGVYTADNASRKILVGETKSTGVPLLHESHAGGQVIFGTDGTLLVSTGDNGTSTGVDVGSNSGTYYAQALTDGIIRPAENVGTLRAQLLNSHCGKILRIDPATGNGVSSNPHFDAANPRAAKSRVWAMGLRNPYRISLKTDTGDANASSGNPGTLLVGDVQWFSTEELHIIEKGGLNCGWPLFEGIEETPSYYEASADVNNQDESGQPSFQSLCQQATSLSINSDAKQRRFTHFPPALDWAHAQDVARYPDFSSGSLVAKTIGSSGALVTGTPFSGNCATSGAYYTGTKFPTNYQKTFFFADYTTNWIKTASLQNNSTQNQIKDVKSIAPNGYCKGVVDLEYCPLDESIFYVNINTGDIQRISYPVNTPINRAPVAAISADRTSGISPVTVNFSSAGSSDPDNDPLTYLWNFGDNTTSTSANPSHTFTSTSSKTFTVNLTVKDDGGLTNSKSIQIVVDILANRTPVAAISADRTSGVSPVTVNFSSAGSSDPDNDPLTYLWNFGDNTTSTSANPSHTFTSTSSKTFTVNLTVKDDGGLTNSKSMQIVVDTPVTIPTVVFNSTKCYRLTAAHSGKVLAIDYPSLSNGVNILQDTWDGSRKQIWRIKAVDNEYYRVQNGYSGSIMDVKSASLLNNANIQQHTYNGWDNQKWKFEKNAQGLYTIIAKHSGKVVDVKGVDVAKGANVQQFSSNGGLNQQWTVSEVNCPAGTVAFATAQIYAADGYRDGRKNIVTWYSNAIDVDYFEVEKMGKNGNFEKITTVNAQPAKEFTNDNYYSYTDNEPLEGENTYRIVLIGDNTPPQYSNPVVLNFKAVADFTLFPNPTNDYVEVDLLPFKDRSVTLTVVDAWGKAVSSLKIEKAIKTHRVELGDLPSGQYVLRIQATGRREVARLFSIVR